MAGVGCCFCQRSSSENDQQSKDSQLIPVSLRYRAFSHLSCLESYFRSPCEYCTKSSLAVGEKVMATNLVFKGHLQNVMGEVISIHKDGSFTLCFADNNELARIDRNPDWEVIVFGKMFVLFFFFLCLSIYMTFITCFSSKHINI
jgi:hypothetical protein